MRYLKTTTIIGLSLLFVACQKEDVELDVRKDHTMMSFEAQMEVVSGAVTRGMPLTDVSQMKDMGVFVYDTGNDPWATAGATAKPNIMLNQKVEQKTANEWTYAPLKPWQNQYNTLFAYAPFATTTTNGITVQKSYTGAPTIEYTVPTTCANQPDLMVAAKQEDKYRGTISFEMEHALACVGFKVNGRYEEKITKIAIKGVSVSGTLSLDHSKDGVPQWTSIATATDTEYIPGLNKGSFDGDGTMMDVMKGDGYLMMIPQTLGPDAKLIVTVDGVDKVAKLNDVEWKAGERYTYNIEITYEPIIVGYLGGWDDVNKVYTKLLQLDWEIAKRDPALKWSNDQTATGADNPYYGITNINILKGLNLDLSNYPAAKYCEDKNKGDGWDKGDDWYLPSITQMLGILDKKDTIPSKFQLHEGLYWCSELTQNESWWVDFTTRANNANGLYSKASTNRVRCVRDVTP